MKRLDIEDQGDGFPILVEQADGRYVKYSDVEGLIAENKILREAIEQLGDLKTQVDSLKQINNDLYTKHIQMRDAFSKLINQCTQLRSVEMYHAGIDLDEAIYVLDGKGHV